MTEHSFQGIHFLLKKRRKCNLCVRYVLLPMCRVAHRFWEMMSSSRVPRSFLLFDVRLVGLSAVLLHVRVHLDNRFGQAPHCQEQNKERAQRISAPSFFGGP